MRAATAGRINVHAHGNSGCRPEITLTLMDMLNKGQYGRYPEYQNVSRREADGYYGWPEAAPFDRIIVTCGIDHIPPELLRQLYAGKRKVIFVPFTATGGGVHAESGAGTP